MKNFTLLIILFTLISKSYSQNLSFTLASPQPQIFEVYTGSIVNGDIDNDGDLDLIQSGIGVNFTGTSVDISVFKNDGSGSFTLTTQNFNNFFTSEVVAIGDLDNDDDLDLIVTGLNRSDLYRNDGTGNFIFDAAAPFQASETGLSIIGDIDGDNDNDVIQFGRSSSTVYFSSIYKNNGTGTFTTSTDPDFSMEPVATASFIDLEGDGDLDLITSGETSTNVPILTVYKNDGTGNFSVFNSSGITPYKSEKISVGDVDNDGDQDILSTGTNLSFAQETRLLLNNGSGVFTKLATTVFPDLFAGTNEFADLDNDSDLDILIVGSMAGGLPNIFSIVYENLGSNNFVARDSLGGEYIAKTTICDLNGDNKKDIIIQGFVDKTNIYWNETVITSIEEKNETPLTVYPNPSNGLFQIKWENATFENIEITDISGRIVYSESINNPLSETIQFNAPSGVYTLKMTGKEKTATHKIHLVK